MPDTRTQKYAEMLSRLIQAETISQENQSDKSKFYRFHDILRGMFPHIFSACTFEDFDGSFLMLWKGTTGENPVLLMNALLEQLDNRIASQNICIIEGTLLGFAR